MNRVGFFCLLAGLAMLGTATAAERGLLEVPAAEAVAAGLSPDSILVDYGSFCLVAPSTAETAQLAQRGLALRPLLGAAGIEWAHGVVRAKGDTPSLAAGLREGPHAPDVALPTFVRCIGPILPAWREALDARCARLVGPVPWYGFLVRATPAQRAALADLPFVEWVGPCHPGHRISPRLSLPAGNTGVKDRIEIVVQVVPDGREAAGLEERLAELGATVKGRTRFSDCENLRLTLPAAAIGELARQPCVTWIEPAPEYRLYGERAAMIAAGQYAPGAGCPTGPGYAAFLAQQQLSGAGVGIMIQDDGVDQGIATNEPGTAHPDLLGRLIGMFNATSDAGAEGLAGHGTINAGIAAGNAAVGTHDGSGYLLGQGIAPHAGIYGTKIFRNSGRFDIGTHTFSSLAGMARRAGCLVSSNSWGADVAGAYVLDSQEFDRLVRDGDPATPGHQPLCFVFAAGNAGPGTGTIGAPATGKNVISVGAAENCDADGTDGCLVGPAGANNLRDLIHFSSRGPTSDGRLAPTLVTVGTHVQGPASTVAGYDGTGVCDRYWPSGQTNYARSSGTSHSTPIVAGAAALFVQRYRDRFGSAPSPALVRAALVNGTVDPAGGNNGTGGVLAPVPNYDVGWGALQLENVFSQDPTTAYYQDQDTMFTSSGQSFTMTVTVVDPSRPLRITLAWTDRYAQVGASPTLVNDLDLIVRKGGTTWYGNRFQQGASVSGGSPDVRNTLENVFLPEATGGYEVTVRASNLAGDAIPDNGIAIDQDFALVVTNGTDQTRAGVVRWDRKGYPCGDVAEITVSDADLKGAGQVDVSCASNPTGDRESVRLFENPAYSGILSGQLVLVPGSAMSNGMLEVGHGDVLRAEYRDADNGSGSPAVVAATAEVDCQGPVISEVTDAERTAGSFVVRWRTDEPATGTVRFGTDPGNLDAWVSNPALRREHEVLVSGLAGAVYFLQVECEDAVGNRSVDSNGGALYRVDLTPPVPRVEPASVSVRLRPDAEQSMTVFLHNDGTGLPFRWSAVELGDSFQPLGAGTQGGGPDGAGYVWIGSGDPQGPAFEFVDIRSTGIAVSGFADLDDGSAGPFAIGFAFPFYGEPFQTFRVCTNGFLSFVSDRTDWDNERIPSIDAPPALVAPFWDDLTLVSGGAIHYQRMDATTLIVQWTGVYHYGSGGPYTFQAVLKADGSIRFHYLTMAFPTESATVGIQNRTQDIALQVAYNQPLITSQFAVLISRGVSWLEEEPSAGELAAGATAPVRLRFDSAGLVDGVYGTSLLFAGETASASASVELVVRTAEPRGELLLDQEAYLCYDVMAVELRDSDLSGDGTADVTITTSRGDRESLRLVEQGASGVFTGSATLVQYQPIPGDGLVAVQHGERIEATYADADDGTGNPATVVAAAVADCRGPKIEGVRVTERGGTTFAVEWNTDEPATSMLRLGETCAERPISVKTTELATHQRLVADGLLPDRFYYFTVQSTDALGNTTTDNNSGACYRAATYAKDSDRDGIGDWLEGDPPAAGRTNRYLPDSDGDGLGDGIEDRDLSGSRDPGETNARQADSDGDGLEDGVEVKILGSNPLSAGDPGPYTDADGDRLPAGIDPDDGDSDRDDDRFRDGYEAEVLDVTAVVDAGRRPRLGDIDGDGFIGNLDALIIQARFLGLQSPDAQLDANADTNRDGFITNLDALMAQTFFLRLKPLLP